MTANNGKKMEEIGGRDMYRRVFISTSKTGMNDGKGRREWPHDVTECVTNCYTTVTQFMCHRNTDPNHITSVTKYYPPFNQ